jgi:hypothetical protein
MILKLSLAKKAPAVEAHNSSIDQMHVNACIPLMACFLGAEILGTKFKLPPFQIY